MNSAAADTTCRARLCPGVTHSFCITRTVSILSDAGQPDAVRRSIEATAGLIAAEAAFVEIVEARGATPAARAFSVVAQGDWVSYGAALRRGVDPTPVRSIDVLKAALT